MQGVIVLIESWYYELWNRAPHYSTHLYSGWMHFPWSETNPEYLWVWFVIITKYGSGLRSESGNELTGLIRSPSHYSPRGWGHLKTGHYKWCNACVWCDQLAREKPKINYAKLTNSIQQNCVPMDHENLLASQSVTPPRNLRLCQNHCYGVMCRVRCSLVYVDGAGCWDGSLTTSVFRGAG